MSRKTKKQLLDQARLKTDVTEENYCPIVESLAETEHNHPSFTKHEDPLRRIDMMVERIRLDESENPDCEEIVEASLQNYIEYHPELKDAIMDKINKCSTCKKQAVLCDGFNWLKSVIKAIDDGLALARVMNIENRYYF